MGFDTKAFMKAKLVPRMEYVEVDGLHHWFEGLTPEQVNWLALTEEQKKAVILSGGQAHHCYWKVRGLSSAEKITCDQAAVTNKSIDDLLKAIASNANKINEIRKAVGIHSDTTPEELVRRLQQLVIASVEPEIEHDVAVKLAETRPAEFFILTNKIMLLTASGMDLAKSKPSGKTKV